MLSYIARCNLCGYEFIADNVVELPDDCPKCDKKQRGKRKWEQDIYLRKIV